MKTLSAIARELGVSAATVSYVYHNKWREKRIHPDLAARVRRKLEAEGGMPDPLGRQLQSGRTQTVGLLLPHLDQPYFLHLLAGIEGRLSEADHLLILAHARGRREMREVALVERLLSRRVDALIMSPLPCPELDTRLAEVRRDTDVPVVFVDTYLPGLAAARVTSANLWGAREAVRRLLADGRRRPLFIGGDPEIAALKSRYDGYCAALREAGVEPDPGLCVWRRGAAGALGDRVRALFAGDAPPDAVFTDSFYGFMPVFELLHELGVSHPREVLVAGFDRPRGGWGHEVVRAVVHEPLLMVLQKANEMGQTAAELALRAIDGEDVTDEIREIRPVLSWAR